MDMGLDKLEITLPQFENWNDLFWYLESEHDAPYGPEDAEYFSKMFPNGVRIGSKYIQI